MATFENRKEYEAFIIQHASAYNVVAFRGRGVVDREEAKSLEEARVVASKLYSGKPVAIYAIAGSAACHLENWEPTRRK
jgi:hypothetical protein